jgi:hypothetical protein
MKPLIASALILLMSAASLRAEGGGAATTTSPRGIRGAAASVDFSSIYGQSPVRQSALPGAPQRKVGAAMSLGLLGALGGIYVGGAMAGRSATECPWAPFLGMNVGAVIGAISGYRLAR